MASFTLSVFSRKCFWVREVDHNKKTAIIMMHLHWNNCLQASACLAALLKAQMFMEVRQQDDVSCVASRKWLLLQLVGNCWKMHYRSDTGNKACATLKDKYPVCCASACAGSWWGCHSCVCTCDACDAALQHCSPFEAQPSTGRACWELKQRLGSMTLVAFYFTCLSSISHVAAKDKWQFSKAVRGLNFITLYSETGVQTQRKLFLLCF